MNHSSNVPAFYRRLPNLHTVEVFAVAARAGSFTRAARELKVTQSAISRQVQQLELSLGTPLFIRSKRGLRLTADGEALLPVVDEAFGRLAKICDSVRSASQMLTLRMPPTLASRWFLPRLPSLRAALGDVDVRVTTYDAWQLRFEDADIDAAIMHGQGDWPDLEVVRLMPELLTPVCAPAFAQTLRTPADVGNSRLLHCESTAAWRQWLDVAGVTDTAVRRGPTFDTLELALSAATRGQGIALGDLNLIRESLRDGVLVAPFERVLHQGIGYYLVYPPYRASLPKIRALRDWLARAARE
jgi:DNA-binding transcriptional LysR family regulator